MTAAGFYLSSDFPGDVSGRCAAERASPLLWKNRTKRRRASNPAESYTEPGASEADIDSDSGYCSPKHNQAAGATQRAADNTTAATVRSLLTANTISVTAEQHVPDAAVRISRPYNQLHDWKSAGNMKVTGVTIHI